MNMIHKLDSIKYLLHTKYHQDVWDDFSSDIDVWNWMLIHEPLDEVLHPLLRDLKEMMSWSDKEISVLIAEEADGLKFDTPEEARAWLEKLNKFLNDNISVEKRIKTRYSTRSNNRVWKTH